MKTCVNLIALDLIIFLSFTSSTINTQFNYQYNDNCVTGNLSNRQLHKANCSCSLEDLEIT